MSLELPWYRFRRALRRAFRSRDATQPPHQVPSETVRQHNDVMLESRPSQSLSSYVPPPSETSTAHRALITLCHKLMQLERSAQHGALFTEVNGSRCITSAYSQIYIVASMSEMRAVLALHAIVDTMRVLLYYMNRFSRFESLLLSNSPVNPRDYAAAHQVCPLSLARTAVAAMTCMKELALLVVHDPSLLMVGPHFQMSEHTTRILEKAEGTVVGLIVAWRSTLVPDCGFGSVSSQALFALRAVWLSVMESML